MKSIRILSIVGIILGSIAIILSLLFLVLKPFPNPSDTDIPDQDNESFNTDITAKDDTNTEKIEEIALKESGWIPNWGFDLGYDSLVNNGKIISTVLPVLYSIDSSGNVYSRGVSEARISKLIAYTKDNGIRVIPTIGSYDYASMNMLLNTEQSRKKGIDTIVGDIERYGFDGIDLDFERIYSSDKEKYIQFLQELRTELGKINKVLSVTVFAQWENGTYHSVQRESILAQDYTEIGNIADEVRIMAYDYTLSSSQVSGPIAPLSWIKQVLDFSIRYIDREKIWLGVHLYGYEWVPGKAVALTYSSVKNILDNPNITGQFKEDIAEGYAEFGCEGRQRCTMYYQDNQGVQVRRDLAKDYGIAGLSYWRLGGEMEILKGVEDKMLRVLQSVRTYYLESLSDA